MVLSSELDRSQGRGPVAVAKVGGVGPRPGSIALLAGGLVASAAGVIVAAVSHRDGIDLIDEMGTGRGFSAKYAAYEEFRTRERVGAGIAIGGGVLAGLGLVTFVIPTRADRAKAKAAAR